ncbi:MAG TPA: hypothetical protein VK035_00505 [Kiloniellales bacterium]|nr:hypothetical protein [Kiloniellales bacterium]
MTHGRLIEELDLLAYVDDLLDPARRAEVENYLRQDPEAALRIADYRAQNQAIRAAYGHVVSEPPPARLLAVLQGRFQPPRWQRPLRFGALAAALAAAAFFGWSLNGPRGTVPQPSDALVEASLALHSDWSPRPEAVGEAAIEGSTLLPKAIAAEQEGELALRIAPPDLSSLGLRLLGMRPTSSKGVEGVQIIYSDAQGERTSLFLLPAATGGHAPLAVGKGSSGHLAYWRDGPITFALIGENAGLTAENVASQVRGSLRGSPLLFMSPTTGSGLAAGPETSGSLLDQAPLLSPRAPADRSDDLHPETM